MKRSDTAPQPDMLRLVDDGTVPNNERLPLLLYRGASADGDPVDADTLVTRFARCGWGDAWINGIYDFHHYHATAHEVLGIARGTARVQLGGPAGPMVDLRAGDVMVIPAGVGHCRQSASADLSVVGAYPRGQVADLRRATPADRAFAIARIRRVALPESDPLHGPAGPLTQLWR